MNRVVIHVEGNVWKVAGRRSVKGLREMWGKLENVASFRSLIIDSVVEEA
jgi:hypothetical protein